MRTITMKEVRREIAQRKRAYKHAEYLSWKNAIRERTVRLMWLISIVLAFGLPLTAQSFA